MQVLLNARNNFSLCSADIMFVNKHGFMLEQCDHEVLSPLSEHRHVAVSYPEP